MNRMEYAQQVMTELYGTDRSPLAELDPDFAAMKERLIYDEIYRQVKLEPTLRELLILAVATTNQTLREISLHTRAALQAGGAPADIREAVYHCAPYIGLGKTEAALLTVYEVFSAQGIALPLPSQSTVSEENRLEQGVTVQRSIFGDQIDAMRSAAPAGQKHLQDHLSAWCFGDVYTRAGLDLKQRELLTFCILCAQGGCETQVKAHISGNISVGNKRDVLLDALTVCLPYIGFPRTLNALACINELLQESQQKL